MYVRFGLSTSTSTDASVSVNGSADTSLTFLCERLKHSTCVFLQSYISKILKEWMIFQNGQIVYENWPYMMALKKVGHQGCVLSSLPLLSAWTTPPGVFKIGSLSQAGICWQEISSSFTWGINALWCLFQWYTSCILSPMTSIGIVWMFTNSVETCHFKPNFSDVYVK